jgi:hypothetical protein
MATTVRDRTARSRIRKYLAEHGPIMDPSGRATAVLKDAIGYDGSPVAFIQLVTAMDKSKEIERQIRGKRTYQISGLESGAPAVTPPRARTAAAPAVTHPVTGAAIEVDYDELARALLRETWRLAELASSQTASAGETGELEAARQERDQLIAERDEYARRLQQLSAMINGLAPSAAAADGAGQDSADSQSRQLLAELAREQGESRREQAS